MCCGEGTRSILCQNLGCPVHSDKNCERFRRDYRPTYMGLGGTAFEWIRVIVDSDVVVTLIPFHVIERVVLGVDVTSGLDALRVSVKSVQLARANRSEWSPIAM